jgi:hypothetical protein
MSTPYSDNICSDSSEGSLAKSLARIEVSQLEMLAAVKDLSWQFTQLRTAEDTESRRALESRSNHQQQLREMRASIDQLVTTVEYLKSGMSSSTSSHGPVRNTRKW